MSQTDRNVQILSIKMESWIRNATENLEIVKSRGEDIIAIKGFLKTKPCILLGPGPSLDLAKPYLGHHTQDKMMLIACNTALNPLRGAGVIPDIVVAYDAAEDVGAQIEEYVNATPKELLENTVLICPVCIHPRVPKAWPGRIIWFRHHDETTPETTVYTAALKAMYPNLNALGNCSCVFILMVDIAHEMEALCVLSVGFDLPVTLGATYCAVRYDLSKDPPFPLPQGHKTQTESLALVHRQYATGLLNLISLTGVPFVNLSPLASYKDMVMTAPVNTIAVGLPKLEKDKANGKN